MDCPQRRQSRIAVDRIAVGGKSARGNLAAAAALHARNQNGPAIAFQLLEVPALDRTLTGSPSFAEVCQEFPDFATGMSELVARYLSSPGADPHNPYVSPLAAPNVAGLPPALLLACENDPVRDDSSRYAKRSCMARELCRSPAVRTPLAGRMRKGASRTLRRTGHYNRAGSWCKFHRVLSRAQLLSRRRKAISLSSRQTAAATGIATSAPTIPSSAPPIRTAGRLTAAGTCTVRFMTLGTIR